MLCHHGPHQKRRAGQEALGARGKQGQSLSCGFHRQEGHGCGRIGKLSQGRIGHFE